MRTAVSPVIVAADKYVHIGQTRTGIGLAFPARRAKVLIIFVFTGITDHGVNLMLSELAVIVSKCTECIAVPIAMVLADT